jgi:hypothetical protein
MFMVHQSNNTLAFLQGERACLEQLNTAAQELASQRRLIIRVLPGPGESDLT